MKKMEGRKALSPEELENVTGGAIGDVVTDYRCPDCYKKNFSVVSESPLEIVCNNCGIHLFPGTGPIKG